MPHHLLDTNHAASLVTLGHPLRERFGEQSRSGDTFSVCVPIVTETLFGIGILPRAKQNLAEWSRLKPSLTCYVPDEADAESAAELQIALRRRGWQLATVDATIAVIALRYDLTLLTTDKDFNAVPMLRLANWL